MANTKRYLILGGGHVAALTLLLLSACGPGGDKHDSGQIPDAGPMADADVDMPDANVPPGDSGDMTPDLGVDGGMVCTDEMRLNRVVPPCDPDNNPEFGPGTVPADLGTYIGPGHTWNGPSGGTNAGTEIDGMGRLVLGMHIAEAGSEPYTGYFYYSADGNWYANWANRNVDGVQGNHARIIFSTDRQTATLDVYVGNSDVSTPTFLWRS